MILRDRDTSADGTLDERPISQHRWTSHCQSWRPPEEPPEVADVVAILTSNGEMAEQVRYSGSCSGGGVPCSGGGIPLGDVDGDGDVDSDDEQLIRNARNEYVGDPGYDVRADLTLNGQVTTGDESICDDHDGDALGWDGLSIGTIVEATDGQLPGGVGNRKGYAGYEHDHVLASAWSVYDVRHRVYNADLGRWLTRDPLGYVDGMSLYEYAQSRATSVVDPFGLQALFGGPQLPDPHFGGGGPAGPGNPLPCAPGGSGGEPKRRSQPGGFQPTVVPPIAVPSRTLVTIPGGGIRPAPPQVVCIVVSGVVVCLVIDTARDRIGPITKEGVRESPYCKRLSNKYKTACNAKRACDKSMNCATLDKYRARNRVCRDTRRWFTRDCVKDWARDLGHDQAFEAANNALNHCIDIMKDKGCRLPGGTVFDEVDDHCPSTPYPAPNRTKDQPTIAPGGIGGPE